MSTTETFYAQPELQPERRKRNKVAIVLAVLVGVLVLSLAGTVVTLVNSQSKYDTLSTKYDAQTSQVKDLNGQVKGLDDKVSGLKYQMSTLREQVRLGRASAHAAILLSDADSKLLAGYNKDVFSRLYYIQEAVRFINRAYDVAKANGYSSIEELFKAAAAGGGFGTTL